MIRRPPRSTQCRSSAASDVYKRQALDHGILPSLSPDVETNMTTDPFSLMRGAYCLQRALANDLAFPISNPGELAVPQVLTSRQVVEMATIAGAAANRVLDKVGTLTPVSYTHLTLP